MEWTTPLSFWANGLPGKNASTNTTVTVMLEISCGLMDTHPKPEEARYIGRRNGISDGLYGEEVEFVPGYSFNRQLTCQLINNPSLSSGNAFI